MGSATSGCWDSPGYRCLDAAIAPWLLELSGLGPISAAQVLVSWSPAGGSARRPRLPPWRGQPHPGLVRADHQAWLNRSGDRQLNRALHTIVLARLRDDADTRAYAARRRSEGKGVRDVRRCFIGRVSVL
jgi:transposase